MIEKPFLLDPAYGKLLESSAFRHRFAEKLLGKRSEPWVLFAFAHMPTVVIVVVGLVLDHRIMWAGALWGGIICVMFGIGGAAVWSERQGRDRLRRLAFEGELVTGRLIHCVRRRQGPAQPDTAGSYFVEMHYAVTTPEGKEVCGAVTTTRDDLLLHDPLPTPGTPVLVLMIDETQHAML